MKKIKKLNFLCIGIIFLYLVYLTAVCPYITDDYHFKFVWQDFEPCSVDRRVSSFSDIVLSMRNYYKMSGGRVLCHFVVYLLMLADKCLFNILNAAVFVLFGILVYKLALSKSEQMNLTSLPVIFLLLFFLPSFGDDVLWLSGAVNYLWSTTLILFTVYETEQYFKKNNHSAFLKMCLAVFVSSFTNEISGGMLFVFIFIWVFTGKRKIILKNFIPLICTIPGTLVVMTAPGNAVRSVEIERIEAFSLSKILFCVREYLVVLCSNSIMIFMLTVFIVVFAYCCYINGLRNAINRSRFFITGFLGLTALGLSGVYILRPTFMPAVFILICYIQSIVFTYRISKIYFAKRVLLKHLTLIKYSTAVIKILLIVALFLSLVLETVMYSRLAKNCHRIENDVCELMIKNDIFDTDSFNRIECKYLSEGVQSFIFPNEALLYSDYYYLWYYEYCKTEYDCISS